MWTPLGCERDPAYESWLDVSGSSNTTTKMSPKSGVTYTGVSGFVTWRTGTFRTAVRGSAYLNGEYAGSTDWGYSDECVYRDSFRG